jgi:hypothetical protein
VNVPVLCGLNAPFIAQSIILHRCQSRFFQTGIMFKRFPLVQANSPARAPISTDNCRKKAAGESVPLEWRLASAARYVALSFFSDFNSP